MCRTYVSGPIMRCASSCRVRKLRNNCAVGDASFRDHALVHGHDTRKRAPKYILVACRSREVREGGAPRPDGQGVSRVRGWLLLPDGCECGRNFIVPDASKSATRGGGTALMM